VTGDWRHLSMVHSLTDAVYLALAAGAFLEGEAVMLSAGALAQSGKLSWTGVVLAGAAGSAAWGQVWFQIGRRLGPELLRRYPRWEPRVRSIRHWLSTRGDLACLSGRFIAGMGTVLPAAIGASDFAVSRFIVLDALGALIWAAVLGGVGFGAGRVLHDVTGLEFGFEWAAGAVSVVIVIALVSFTRQRAAAPKNGDRRVVMTADDFGLAEPFNEAVELAHRRGLLSTASLMMNERATANALEVARRNPRLRVGLHLTLCEGRPRLPVHQIPLLVGRDGEFFAPVSAIVRFTILAFSRGFRRELEAEIRAQFVAFQATGLELDHVSGHNNLHLHPAVLPLLVRVAHDFGAKAIRVPYEPPLVLWRAGGGHLLERVGVWSVMGTWALWAKLRLAREGIAANDYLFGVFDCGSMTRERLLSLIPQLPPGTSEIHLHPATRSCAEIAKNTPTYRHREELAALVDPAVAEAFAAQRVQLAVGYRELAAPSAVEHLGAA
jgi:chitin disaccharide deacetylase